MAITKLTVENFKSFDKLEVELRPFNIVVGSNASGKSNFLDVFRFLRDIADESLESAIGIRGGTDALRNFSLNKNQDLRISLEADDNQEHLVHARAGRAYGKERDRITYELAVRADESDAGFRVVTDRLTEHFNVLKLDEVGLDRTEGRVWLPSITSGSDLDSGRYVAGQRIGEGRTRYCRVRDVLTCNVVLPEGLPFTEKRFHIFHGTRMVLGRPQEVILGLLPRVVFLLDAPHSLTHIATYDFDPRKAQLAVPPSGSRELDADAENLSVILRDILRRPESKKRLINLVSVLLPFVHDLDVEEFGFGQLMTTLTERFSDKGHPLPAFFASDGTVACLALVVALYFQESAVTIFEEPDRHIHPHLAGRVMQMMNEVTERTQVIVTTHNPELLRHANLEDILLVTRDHDGHSQVTRPADSEVLGHFLQNELGVEDLFVQNLLDL